MRLYLLTKMITALVRSWRHFDHKECVKTMKPHLLYTPINPNRSASTKLCITHFLENYNISFYREGILIQYFGPNVRVLKLRVSCRKTEYIDHTWAPCGYDWSCVILDWSEGPFFWHFKTANACLFSKVYTTMKFQLVCRKFQLVCTPIPECCNWSVQTHWSEGAHVWYRD